MNQKSIQYLTRKFINHLMISGKKEKAEKIFKESLDLIRFKEGKDGLLVFLLALENTKPFVELRSVRRGGATYQVPVPLYEKRSLSLSIKWIIDSARKRKGNSAWNLSQSFIESSKNLGESVKKRENIHGIALKNRSFTHFRWF